MIAATGRDETGLQSRWPTTDNENAIIAAGFGRPLRMPTLAPLLTDRRILGTAHRNAIVPTRYTDIAANAFANLILPAGLYFVRQEGVGNRGPRTADKVENTALNLRHHGVRGSEPSHADHRFLCDLFDEINHRLVGTLRAKTGRPTIGGAGIHFHIPQIGKIA